MKVYQHEVTLRERKKGFHLITSEILDAIGNIQITTGICNIFIQHTSASLTINENADASVRKDFETYFRKAVPENDPDYIHRSEGPDDMPAHIRSSLLDSTVSIPVSNGRFNLGTWQGIYLCEHRNHGGPRDLIITFMGI